MSKVLRLLNAVRKDEEGVTMVEYAILLGLISIVAIAVIGNIGATVNSIFGTACTSLGTISRRHRLLKRYPRGGVAAYVGDKD